MKITDKFTVVKSEKKSGTTSAGKAWEKTEYLLKNNLEREDGSMIETMITADTTQSIGELEVGADYEATLFITSRPYTNKDGKEIHMVSFRVTYVNLISPAAKSNEQKKEEIKSVSDEIPF